MRFIIAIMMTLLLQSVVTAFEALGGFGTLRIEPAIPVFVLAAFWALPFEAAVLAGALGLASDLMALSPLGLHVLVFGIVFFVARALVDWLGLRSFGSALLLVLFVSVLTRILLTTSLLIFTEQIQAFTPPLTQFAAALIDALLTLPLWTLLQKLWAERDDGVLAAARWGRR